MHSFNTLSEKFAAYFDKKHFPEQPSTLYAPNEYFLKLGGKRVRPVLALMGNELFDEISPDAWYAATAIELFHNFTLIHDDIMDKAPLRRGMETVHSKYGNNTALLAGDVMLVRAYECLNQISISHLKPVMSLFNKTATEVCEGQQLDMDFESRDAVSFDEYLQMITLKTSVALAASLRVGSLLGGASERNQDFIYEFGKKLGIAFQVQDDYLDAFGNPGKFGKQVGGDIIANKKTFLLIHAMENASALQKNEILYLIKNNPADKIEKMLEIFHATKADSRTLELKNKYLDEALQYLEDIAVISKRKEPLHQLAQYLVKREH